MLLRVVQIGTGGEADHAGVGIGRRIQEQSELGPRPMGVSIALDLGRQPAKARQGTPRNRGEVMALRVIPKFRGDPVQGAAIAGGLLATFEGGMLSHEAPHQRVQGEHEDCVAGETVRRARRKGDEGRHDA